MEVSITCIWVEKTRHNIASRLKQMPNLCPGMMPLRCLGLINSNCFQQLQLLNAYCGILSLCWHAWNKAAEVTKFISQAHCWRATYPNILMFIYIFYYFIYYFFVSSAYFAVTMPYFSVYLSTEEQLRLNKVANEIMAPGRGLLAADEKAGEIQNEHICCYCWNSA